MNGSEYESAMINESSSVILESASASRLWTDALTVEQVRLDRLRIRDLETALRDLETALRELMARVERVGGYASHEDQATLWRAEQALL